MAVEVVMPKLGATMEEGTIVSWLISEGEIVEEGDPIAEIQTDKIILEIEAEVTGVLLKTLYEAGSTVNVHEIVAYLGEEGEVIGDIPTPQVSVPAAPSEVSIIEDVAPVPVSTSLEKIRRTPAARKLAEQNEVELSDIQGTGPLGRIQKVDVENYLDTSRKKITPLAKKIALEENIDYQQINGTGPNGKVVKKDVAVNRSNQHSEEEAIAIPLSGMRKVIAKRMSESAFTAPHVTIISEIDMTNCVMVRKDLLLEIEKLVGFRLSFNELIMKATALALEKHPNINASLHGNEIIYHKEVNLGFAVAVPDGLYVPVVKNVNKLGLAAITKECKTLGKQARDGKLAPDSLQGGTFTISNLGMYAVDGFSPIINQPQSAILGVGRIQEKPVALNGEIVIRSMMTLSLSFDHRIIDGAPAAAFITDLKDLLENPFKLLI